ncbi:patatin-like phospholipase family protein [Microcoleus sp. FACHB-672]|uniref:patatin-like phospholipase family protein n=1 Tax=Microcoleus sp. FACHB-672 TaxID=2692825 RepID=UPI001688C23E|nr:patatin-like phospholipase family protein [Microcoleus sp. FACHB-672]MBD2042875.1 patatin-like phospholipase family protein [Microcoleus sp. FACHB-672]
MPFKFKVLSIDGGGIRGIMPALILAEIEKRTGKRISQLFDLVAGTSTGGILALGVTKPNPANPAEAQYQAEDLIRLYKHEGKRIFPKPRSRLAEMAKYQSLVLKNFWYSPIVNFQNLFRPKFSSGGRESVLTEFLGETPIEEAVTEVFVTSYDTELRMPIFFTSNRHNEKRADYFRKICEGFTMKQAAMATSAAPTYFEPYKVETLHPTRSGFYSLVDGGVVANNPTAMAIIEAIVFYREKYKTRLFVDDILVVSLGTGALTRQFYFEQAKDWGLIKWVRPVINMALDGQSECVDCQLEQLLPNPEDRAKQYYRFQAPLNNVQDDFDDASDGNIKRLEELAQLIIDQRNGDLDELCRQLLLDRPKVSEAPKALDFNTNEDRTYSLSKNIEMIWERK